MNLRKKNNNPEIQLELQHKNLQNELRKLRIAKVAS